MRLGVKQSNMNIRFANEKDAAVLARLNRKFNKTQDTEQQVADRIKASRWLKLLSWLNRKE
jgi:hypothetical protein